MDFEFGKGRHDVMRKRWTPGNGKTHLGQGASKRVLLVGTRLRGRHYGQRPMSAALTGRTHGRTDRDAAHQEIPCQRGAVHTWPISLKNSEFEHPRRSARGFSGRLQGGRGSDAAGWECAAGHQIAMAAVGRREGLSFASLRRFCAVAARRNSSRAPHGPRSLSRAIFRIRLR